ncbi:uncharacterized protein EI97DRAFT_404009 [Westerdykella ornata]|uniref:Uncharacterized protein n=1 Tax=Westerdykella ornata TaxID=318751 RepID=A0A6A6JD28_WESOR|nr:uncharacterized protein EI97DRAFT_404009 [Westerdykella ornata]KAF2273526.1 hypothetical protein EI97DRAFT_404009 [Westerdykella ornata]
MSEQQVAVPLRLQAFVLNQSIIDEGDVRLAPITQPNFTGLRIDPAVIQNDVQEHVDPTSAKPSTTNSRITHLDTGELRRSRCGVYLHWEIPRMYRGGAAATESGDSRSQFRNEKGLSEETATPATPDFLPIPNRWLVTRRIDPDAVVLNPTSKQPAQPIPQFRSWVVESDRIRTLDEFPKNADIEVESVPFLHGADTTSDSIKAQAQVFVGQVFDAPEWPGEDRTVPRANLSVLASSNPLFADYQPFNSGVFSLIDNFQYIDETNSIDYFAEATASYSVIGWHSDASQDPFSVSNVPHSKLLQRSFMSLYASDQGNSFEHTWVQQSSPTRGIYHGAMYNVNWIDNGTPSTWPGNKFAKSFNNSQPLAVGNTAMDALVAYLRTIAKPTELEVALLALQNLLIKQNDGVDVQQEAADLLSTRNFSSSTGGRWWTLSGEQSGSFSRVATSSGTKSPLDELDNVNKQQRALNIMRREKSLLQWELFAEWWKAVTLPAGTKVDDTLAKKIIGRLLDLGDDTLPGSQIGKAFQEIKDSVHSLSDSSTVVHATEQPFLGLKDPTVLLAGVSSPWPTNYADNLAVRLASRIATSATVIGPVPPSTDSQPDWKSLDAYITALGRGGFVFPSDLWDNIVRLLLEFRTLRPQLDPDGKPVPLDLSPSGATFPSFHDDGTMSRIDGLDRWMDTQPFFPLFLEWEGEYSHVEYDSWALEDVASTCTPGTVTGVKKLQYVVSTDLRNKKLSVRALSGRTLILPQASLSLEQSVKQILAQTPPDQNPLDPGQVATIVDNLRQLPVLSATLTGFTNHLRTQLAGGHVKPLLRSPGKLPVPMEAGVVSHTAFTIDSLALMGQKTGTTPYGNLVSVDPSTCPFKPATHGQFKFTKFNLIDRFGQTVCAITPSPRRTDGTTEKNRLYPCLSDNYKPQLRADGTFNTVEPDPDGKCSFVQIPPYINQDARINAHIVVEDMDPNTSSKWRVAEEWEQQAVGWIVVNFPDFGLQIFQPDGTFYRELRNGGPWPVGEGIGAKWQPFERPKNPPDDTALDKFIAQLEKPEYMAHIFTLLSSAAADLQSTPNEYSGYLQALIGRPFAIVNMGWSLELATAPLYNQASGTASQPPPFLLPPNTSRSPVPQTYSFPLKLGDQDRKFDGLVCYFNAISNNAVDYSTIMYYDKATQPSVFPRPPPPAASTVPFPTLSPFYIPAPTSGSGPAVTDSYNKELQVFGAIIDPFNTVHGYSSILPVKQLTFPHWRLEKALRSMTYFFQAGPLLVPKDVPPFNKDYIVSSDSPVAAGEKLVPDFALPVPAVAVGDWMWLQPHLQDGLLVHNPLALNTNGDELAKFEKVPYTAVEGYMQLRGPLEKEDAKIKT